MIKQQYLKSQPMGKAFCYWDVKNLPDAILALVFLSIVLTIFMLSVLRIREIKRHKVHGRIVKIYVLITVWALLFLSQLLYGAIVYFCFIMGQQDLSLVDIDSFSRSFTRIDIVPAFVIQTLFLEICKLYYRGLTNTIEVSRLANWEIKFIKFLKGYCVVRVINQSIGVLLVNILNQDDDIQIYNKANAVVLVFDCTVINVLLLISLKIYILRFRESGRIEESDLRELKQEYGIMIMTSLLRIIIDVAFLIMPILPEDSQGRCIGLVDGHLVRTIFYNCVANIINHVLPIVWFLKIYSFKSLSEKQSNQTSNTSEESANNLIKSILE